MTYWKRDRVVSKRSNSYGAVGCADSFTIHERLVTRLLHVHYSCHLSYQMTSIAILRLQHGVKTKVHQDTRVAVEGGIF